MSFVIIAIHAPIVNHIFSFLTYVERICLLKAYPKIHKFVKKQLECKPFIKEGLKRYGIPVKPFLIALTRGQGYLSGSFILSCLTGHAFKPNDIDVFCVETKTIFPGPNINPKHIYSLFSYELYQIGLINKSTEKHSITPKYAHMNGIMKVRNLFVKDTSKKSIQEIRLNEGSIFDHIDNFDFEFNKIMYDGKKLYVKNWNSIIYGKCVVDVNDVYDEGIQKRTHHPKNICSAIKNLKNRQIKYQKRGYLIKYQYSQPEKWTTIWWKKQKLIHQILVDSSETAMKNNLLKYNIPVPQEMEKVFEEIAKYSVSNEFNLYSDSKRFNSDEMEEVE